MIIAGYAGNYFNLPLFFGVDFLFGSIAVLLVVRLYGTAWGTIAAAIASVHTALLWGHPYAAIILTLEGLVIGLWQRRQRFNLLLLDGFYWIFIGMPLVWVFYGEAMGLQAQPVLLVMLKQGINGIFNALIASLLLTHSFVYQWVARPKVTKTLSLQQIIFNLLIAFVLFPAITLLVLSSRSALSNIETTIQANLEHLSTDVIVELGLWQQQNLDALHQLAEFAARSDMTPSTRLQESTELLQRTFPAFQQLLIVNGEGKAISYSGKRTVSSSYSLLNRMSKNNTAINALELNQKSITSDIFLTGDDSSSLKLVQMVPIKQNYRSVGCVVSEIDLAFFDQFLKSFNHPKEIELTFLDSRGRVITSTRSDLKRLTPFDPYHGGEIHPLNAEVYQWLPLGKMPIMMRWKNSFYVRRTPAGNNLPLTAIVEVPTQFHFSYLQNLYIKSLGSVFAIATLALILASSISRWLAKPILQLAEVTTDLPNKFLDQKAIALHQGTIDWPKSWVTEMNVLVSNFQFMADLLQEKFQEIKNAKEQLEERVKERTRELSAANRELEIEVAERIRIAESLQHSEALLRVQAEKLESALEELKQAQVQLIHTEKMSSLGQLVAGVAHEINNPLSSIYGNLFHAKGYTQDLLDLVDVYQQEYLSPTAAIQEKVEAIDLEFLRDDLPALMDAMQISAERIYEIVQLLRKFSRADEAEMKEVDIHEGIDSTLLILKNRLKASATHPRIEVIKEYGTVPLVECYPGQLNQVFMNILTNAIDSLEEQFSYKDENKELCQLPWIRIRTEVVEGHWVTIYMADNGLGIAKEKYSKLFDPFFTTKPVGKGTGLGLSISYKIIAEKHGGKLYCISEPKQGAQFIIQIPLRQQRCQCTP
ncbi:MAG TPA: ATP-binding protein [Coleofasciculaceae cyanobacterium]